MSAIVFCCLLLFRCFLLLSGAHAPVFAPSVCPFVCVPGFARLCATAVHACANLVVCCLVELSCSVSFSVNFYIPLFLLCFSSADVSTSTPLVLTRCFSPRVSCASFVRVDWLHFIGCTSCPGVLPSGIRTKARAENMRSFWVVSPT